MFRMSNVLFQKAKDLVSVTRIDTHGNRFVMFQDVPRDKAEKIVTEYEAKGHKQGYFVEKKLDFPKDHQQTVNVQYSTVTKNKP